MATPRVPALEVDGAGRIADAPDDARAQAGAAAVASLPESALAGEADALEHMRPVQAAEVAAGALSPDAASGRYASWFDGSDVRASFARMPEPLRAQLDSLYARQAGAFDRAAKAPAYRARVEVGEGHTAAALELGFTLSPDEGSLRAPKRLETLFARYAERMRGLVERGELSLDEAVYPALGFSRRGSRIKEALAEFWRGPSTPQFRFIVPGLDPWPDPKKWALNGLDFVEVPDKDWYGALARGRMPFFIRIFRHDVGHVTELLEPELSRQTRRHARRWLEPGKDRKDMILAELGSLPNVARSPEIRAMLPELFAPGATRSVKFAADALRRMTPEARRSRIDALLARPEALLLRHGGVMRDDYSAPGFYSDEQLRAKLRRELAGWTPRVRPRLLRDAILQELARETLHAQVRELAALRELRYQGRLSTRQGALRLVLPAVLVAGVGRAHREERLDRALVEHAARLETALAAAVDAELTPAKLFAESRNARPGPQSATRRYFEAAYPPESPYRRAILGD